jgi:threonine dehydrogenase-like Zn-dependent dehydrogenase
MKAVVWRGDMTIDIETVEDARIEAPTDVLMRITSSAICGTDLHIYEGRMGEVNGLVIGHEPLGVVEEVGPAVASIKKNIAIGMGRDNDERYNTQLRDLIIAGRAKPDRFTSFAAFTRSRRLQKI